MTNIAQRTLATRRALKLSQDEFAARMRFGRHYISMVERGKAENPSDRFEDQLRLLENEVRLQEEAAKYSSSDEQSSTSAGGAHRPMPPPHLLPARPGQPVEDDAHKIHSKGVQLLGKILDENPALLTAAVAMLEGLAQQQPKP